MRRNLGEAVVGAALVASVCGCGIGYNRMLFVTKTNIGMDVDSKPPTAEITIARREGLIAPTFPGGRTPPALGGFRYYGNFFAPNVQAVFSGGRAAVTIGKLFTTPSTTIAEDDAKAEICVAEKPESRLMNFFSSIPGVGALSEENDSTRPFFFATDTGTGLKVAWSGATGSIPDTLRFGYNRKEFAFAPIFGREKACTPPGGDADSAPGGNGRTGYLIDVPSFLATLDSSYDVKHQEGGSYAYAQFFATGKAADSLALQPDVRRVLGERLDENAFAQVSMGLEQRRAEANRLNLKVKDAVANATARELDDTLAKARGAGLLTAVSFPPGSTLDQKRAFLVRETWAPGDDQGRLEALRTFVNSLGS